jgi:tetratricopeptide (TPR) repeat protein
VKQGEYEKAIRDFNEAIRLNPKEVEAFYGKACCHALLKEADPAIAALSMALELVTRIISKRSGAIGTSIQSETILVTRS